MNRPTAKAVSRRRRPAEVSAATDPLPPLFGPPLNFARVAGALLLAVLLMFGDLLLNGGDQVLSAFGTDLSFSFLQWTQFAVDQVLNHHNLPLWNPHQYSGAPFLGGFQSALLYPPAWIHFALPVASAFNVEIALHVYLAGLFTYAWMARRGLHPVAAGVAGIAFMFGGAYFMHIVPGHLSNLRTMVWAPLVFLAIDDLTSTRSFRGAWLGAGAAAMAVLAGHVQYVYYLGLLAAPYALLCLRKAPSRRHALLGLGLIGIGALGLSAAQLLTGLDSANQSQRSALGYQMAHTFPLPPENLLTLIAPNFFGGPAQDTPYWGRWYLWEDCLFIGSTALALAVYGAVAGGERRRNAAVMVLISLLIAFGSYTPLYGLLFRFLPGFASFRGVSKCAFVGMLFLAALAGIGLDRLLRDEGRSSAWGSVTAGAGVAVMLLALAIWASGMSGPHGPWGRLLSSFDWSNEGWMYGGFARVGPTLASFAATSSQGAAVDLLFASSALVFGGIAWVFSRKRREVVFVIPTLVVLQLLCFAWRSRPTFKLSTMDEVESPLADDLDHVGRRYRVSTGVPCLTMGAGGDDAWGADPMVLRRYARFMTFGQPQSTDDLVRLTGSFYAAEPDAGPAGWRPGYASPLWKMVRLRVMMHNVGGGMSVVPVPGPQLARAQLVEQVRVVEDPEKILAMMTERDFDARRAVLLEKPAASVPASALPSGTASVPAGDAASVPSADAAQKSLGSINLKDIDSDTVEVVADVNRAAVLLFSDNYARGWRARPLQEDQAAGYEVVPADYTLLAVPLSAGHHHFSLRYLPTSYVVGKWISLACLILYGLLALRLWRRRRHLAPGASGP